MCCEVAAIDAVRCAQLTEMISAACLHLGASRWFIAGSITNSVVDNGYTTYHPTPLQGTRAPALRHAFLARCYTSPIASSKFTTHRPQLLPAVGLVHETAQPLHDHHSSPPSSSSSYLFHGYQKGTSPLNKSLQTGSVPALFKAAYITPLLKKSQNSKTAERKL